MNLHIYQDEDQLATALAGWICNLIDKTLQNQETFTLVLSGGETPKLLFKKLASPEFNNKINWKRIEIFWGDEREVPFTDDRNNAKVAFDTLINHVDIPHDQVHIMRTNIEPLFSAKEYESDLHKYFDNTKISFDLVLLGMGNDGHTLSLFPGSLIIEETGNWVNAVYNEEQQMYRITLMPIIVNRASQIVFVVEGDKKALALQQVLEGDYNPNKFPAQIIKPLNGELHWFIDEAAAQKLNKKNK